MGKASMGGGREALIHSLLWHLQCSGVVGKAAPHKPPVMNLEIKVEDRLQGGCGIQTGTEMQDNF